MSRSSTTPLGTWRPFDEPASPQFVSADGQRHPVAPGRWTVGREPDSDLRIGEPTVSRRHAVVAVTNGCVTVADLGSTNGTWVNDRRLGEGDRVRLHHGDVVRFGAAPLWFAGPSVQPHAGETSAIEDVAAFAPPPPTPVAGVPSMGVGQQRADQLNNVIGNQYLQTVLAQREGFLREVAASRTRARRLIWFGLLLFVAGGGAYVWMVIRFVARTADLGPDQEPDFGQLLGEEIGGVPIGLIGFAVAATGLLIMVIGIVLHVVATSRQQRVLTRPVVPAQHSQ